MFKGDLQKICLRFEWFQVFLSNANNFQAIISLYTLNTETTTLMYKKIICFFSLFPFLPEVYLWVT